MSPIAHASHHQSTLLSELARFILPLVTFLAVRAFAVSQANPAGAVESAFLGLLISGVLAAIAALRADRVLAATAVLALTAIWIVDYGPHRGALVTVVLGGGLTLAAGRRWRQGAGELPAELTVPAALGLQLLLRCDLLLPPLLDLRTLVSVLALPVMVALAISALARRHGSQRALLAAAAAVSLAPGWNVTTTAALVGLAAGAWLGDRTAPRWQRALAVVVLVATAGVKPPIGAVFALGGLAMTSPGGWCWATLPAALLAALALPAGRGWPDALELALSGLLLVPALALAPSEDRRPALIGLAILLAGARLGAEPDALAGGLALAALALPLRGAAATLQTVWSASWLAGTGLLAAYPWLRETPREDALALLGLVPGVIALLLVVGVVVALGLGVDFLAARWPHRVPATRHVAAVVMLAALGAALPGQGLVVLGYEAVLLSQGQPIWIRTLDKPGSYTRLVIDSSLVRGAGLAVATPVARVQLLGRDERPLASWDLVAGNDTAEWAAARLDVAGRPGFEAPPPWLSYLAPDGTFFGQRFRARFDLYQPAEVVAVRISRHNQLPESLELVVYRVELRK